MVLLFSQILFERMGKKLCYKAEKVYFWENVVNIALASLYFQRMQIILYASVQQFIVIYYLFQPLEF